MTRLGFAHGLGPTPWEYFVFLLWLVVVVVSMTAMYLVPPFNLLFWPTLWIYDLWQESRTRITTTDEPEVRPKRLKIPGTLWDRELDG